MRLRVELEVAPEEVPLATELVALLRQLTDHVSMKTTDGNAAAASSLASTASRGPSPLPAAAAPSPTPSAPAPAAAATSSGPAPDLHHAASAPAIAGVAPAAAPAAPAMTFPAGTPPQQMMMQLIAASEYAEHPEQLARQLESIVEDPALGGPAQMFPVFVDVWSSIALNPNLPAEERSAVPFVLLLQSMGQQFRDKFRDRIMRDLLKHLTILRPINANRSEYYVHAEAFAALVSIEIVPIEGAIQTMCTLAKNPEKRGAAVTMLGKTVELAGHLIAEKVSAKTQEMMRTTVASITDETFHYDVEYINGTMGWTPGAAAPAASAARTLRPLRTIADGHGEMVFALAVDPAHQQFVSGGKDTFLRVWSQKGQPLQQLDLGDLYISAMDFHPRLSMLLASCINPQQQKLRLAGYTSGQPNGFGPKGLLQRDDMVAVAAVRALPESTGFLTGETILVDRAPAAVVRYWDMAAAPSFTALQPTQTFRGGQGALPTALRGVAGEAALFVSGDKEGGMLLWDLRSPANVGAFGAAGSKAHAAMITSIESGPGGLIVSGSTEKSVALWDVRQLAQPLSRVTADNMTVLKLALNPALNIVAVSAVNGLRLLDITNRAAPVLSAPLELVWPDGRKRATYHDVKWNESLNVLLAAGKDKLVDMYTLA
ncbi:hypothetical protein ABPG75_004240 [Micractinium tetrahymenae]